MNTDILQTHKLYRYDNLSFGKLCSVNREIRETHVKTIFKGLENGTWHRLQQITVDIDTNEIIDGNHRFIALSQYYEKYGSFNGNLVDVIYYKRKDNESLADAIKFFNDDRKPLNSKDYTHISEANGNDAIPLIRKFGMEHALTAKVNKKGEVIGHYERYTYSFIYGKNVTKEVKNNTITITKDVLEQAHLLYTEIEQMIQCCNLKSGSWLEQFIQAWYHRRINDKAFQRQFKKINFNDFCEQIVNESKDWSMDKTTKSDWDIRFASALAYFID